MVKKTAKQKREQLVLIGLIEEFIKTAKPVGSNSLKEAGFEDLSSATIRNYFVELEKKGFLEQLHASGGRIPTEKGWRAYVDELMEEAEPAPASREAPRLEAKEPQEVVVFLQRAAESLGERVQAAVFLQAPRFDHDLILALKLVPIDVERTLCVILTDFGVVRTEMLFSEQKLSSLAVKRIEGYFYSRLTGQERPGPLELQEAEIAKKWYNEVILRYIVGYAHFTNAEVFRVGLSHLLNYPEFEDAGKLAGCLALFENGKSLQLLATESIKYNRLKVWIGSELASYSTAESGNAVMSMPYRIKEKPVGAIGIMGPLRIPYRGFMEELAAYSTAIGRGLEEALYKHKITFRQPMESHPYLADQEINLIEHSKSILLEDKRGER